MPDRHGLAELLAQHQALRVLMDRCGELADVLDATPGADPAPLASELAHLRLAFDAHNKFEEALLRPVLIEHDDLGKVRIDRMVEDHVNEHHEMRSQLMSPTTAALRDAIETLRAHLDAEERYLFTAPVLRDAPATAGRAD